jgi:hypothetical protein
MTDRSPAPKSTTPIAGTPVNGAPPSANVSEGASESAADRPSMPSPLNCLGGAAIAGTIGWGAYLLTLSIAQNFADKPFHTTNAVAANLSALVRTLVVGVAALGAGVFGFVALGLTALAVQLLLTGDRAAAKGTKGES